MPDDKSTQDDQPDLNLIEMVQRARRQHDAQTRPGNVAAVYSIEARCEGADCQQPTPRAGQWVMDTTIAAVDEQWEIIRQATVDGKLGYKSKVSTAPRSAKIDSRTIAVRTYNADDAADVQRVLEQLKALNLPGEWHYERD